MSRGLPGGAGAFGGPGGFGGVRLGPVATPRVVKEILVALLAVFVLQVILLRAGLGAVVEMGALSGALFWKGMIWQPLTATFLHDDQNLFHLLGNMFMVWMFGSPVADRLGRRAFLLLFVGGGAAAGLLKMIGVLAVHLLGVEWSLLPWETPSVGASGAVFVLLTWYCLSWPDREISLLFVPLVFTARQALPLWFVVEFGFSAGGSVDHAIHLAGVAVGWASLRFLRRGSGSRRPSPPPPARSHLRVVRGSGGGPHVH